MQVVAAMREQRPKLTRLLYGTLLLGWALVLMTSLPGHGPSERGWVLPIGYLIELTPLLVLLVQTLWPSRLLWWLIAIFWFLFGALTLFDLVRTAWILGALFRILILAWVFGVLYYDRPTTTRRYRKPPIVY